MSKIIDYFVENEIALITMNNPPVNSLSLYMCDLLTSYYRQARDDAKVRGIVIASMNKNFSAGADITEFDSTEAQSGSKLLNLCNELDSSPKLLVAAINGVVLGGGLELAMGADYRIAKANAILGLPETTLGIIPGAGGTQRLPRLVAPQLAAEMMLTGKTISALEALQSGLIDRLYEGDLSLVDAAVEYVNELLATDAPLRDAADIKIDKTQLPDNFFQNLRDTYIKNEKTSGALLSCIQAIEAACNFSLKEGLAREHELFQQRMQSSEARAIQYLFFAERNTTKVPGLDRKTPTRTIKKAGIIGAGLMGSGIAMSFVKSGIPVILVDSNEENVKRGLAGIEKVYQGSVRKGRITEEQSESYMALLKGSVDYTELGDADIVIEAVFEDMEVKKQVFRKLDEVCKPGAILATNTSTLDVNDIAGATSRSGDVIGLHFFSPAHVMKLLEIVRAERTVDDVLLTSLQLARSIGKIPVVVGVCHGFVGNRMMAPYIREAYRMLLEGAAPEAVDAALTDFGMAMGVISVVDMVGIDIICKSADGNKEQWNMDKSYLELLFRLRDLGYFGQKTGKGVYIYENRQKSVNPELADLIVEIAKEHDIQRRDITYEEITERCLYTLINEGACILEEGISSRSSDIDVIYVNGYGFPAAKGGPMHYADVVGLDVILDSINKYQRELGEYGELWFKPSSLLEALAAESKKFKDYQH